MNRYQRNDDWVGSQVDDSFVMLHIDTAQYLIMNETALAIWQKLAEPKSVEEIVDLLVEEYEVERPDCEAGVLPTLHQMTELKLIGLV